MGEVIQVDGSGVRMPVAQRGKLRMTAVEVAHMRIDLRTTLFGLQVSVALGATDVRGFRQPRSPQVFNVARAAGGSEGLPLTVYRSIVTAQAGCVGYVSAEVAAAHVAHLAILGQDSVSRRKRPLAVHVFTAGRPRDYNPGDRDDGQAHGKPETPLAE
jgi:hypothetical protein